MNFYMDKTRKKAVEGFLGDKNECEILFILREPNSNGEVADKFWFREVLEGNSIGTKYVNVLGRLCGIITKQEYDTIEKRKNLLKKCCYINFHPHFGEKNKSETYKMILDNFRDGQDNEIVKNRIALINFLIEKHNCRKIVTVSDIFNILCRNSEKYEWLSYDNNKKFFRGKYKSADVYEFYHPSFAINYDKLDKNENVNI